MRYRRPFTPQQRRDAAARYRSYRSNYRAIRSQFAPRNRVEHTALRKYGELIRRFKRELAKPGNRVDADELNAIDLMLMHALAAYVELRGH
jgi:hypothetical protein